MDLAEEFVDHGLSGAKGRDQRPAFDKMLKAAVRKEFDVLAAWSVDRLGRSLQHLVGFLDEIHSKRIDLLPAPARDRRHYACRQGAIPDVRRFR